MEKKRFEALDAFRGICALSVAIFHLRLLGSFTELEFFRGSAIFVEFFFVLSGFVLAHGYGFKENLKFMPFMKARFFRLYPLHFFMFLVFIILELLKLAAFKFGVVFNHEPFTGSLAVREIMPNLLLIQSWTPFTDYLSYNYPSWSISIEFYVYMLLFLTIIGFGKLKTLIWFLIPLTALYLLTAEPKLIVEPALRGLSCFFGGAFMYAIYRKIAHLKPSKIIGSIVELCLLCAVLWVVQSNSEYRSIAATLLFCMVVLMFSFESGIFSNYLKFQIFQTVGKLSYSIYMTHAAILWCFMTAMKLLQKKTGFDLIQIIEGKSRISLGSEILSNITVLLLLAFIIFISHLTYKYIELVGQAYGRRSAPSFKMEKLAT